MARQRTMRRHSPPPAAALAPPTAIRWRAAIIVLAGFLAYANSFSGPFVFDDRISIVENAQIRDVWKLDEVLFPRRELPTAGRPLVNLSFAVNYALGGLDVGGYHVANLACHLLCGLLVFGVVRRTLELPALRDRFGGSVPNQKFGDIFSGARRPDGKARRPSIPGVCEGGATQSAGMHRRSNADGVAPRAARAAALRSTNIALTTICCVWIIVLLRLSRGNELQSSDDPQGCQ